MTMRIWIRAAVAASVHRIGDCRTRKRISFAHSMLEAKVLKPSSSKCSPRESSPGNIHSPPATTKTKSLISCVLCASPGTATTCMLSTNSLLTTPTPLTSSSRTTTAHSSSQSKNVLDPRHRPCPRHLLLWTWMTPLSMQRRGWTCTTGSMAKKFSSRLPALARQSICSCAHTLATFSGKLRPSTT